MHEPFTLTLLNAYSMAVFAAGWIIPWATLLRLRKRGKDSSELSFVAKAWGGTAAVGLGGYALAYAGLETFILLFSLAIFVYYAGGFALIVVGFMRIRRPSVGLPLILCGLLVLSAVAAHAYTSAERSWRPKMVVTRDSVETNIAAATNILPALSCRDKVP